MRVPRFLGMSQELWKRLKYPKKEGTQVNSQKLRIRKETWTDSYPTGSAWRTHDGKSENLESIRTENTRETPDELNIIPRKLGSPSRETIRKTCGISQLLWTDFMNMEHWNNQSLVSLVEDISHHSRWFRPDELDWNLNCNIRKPHNSPGCRLPFRTLITYRLSCRVIFKQMT